MTIVRHMSNVSFQHFFKDYKKDPENTFPATESVDILFLLFNEVSCWQFCTPLDRVCCRGYTGIFYHLIQGTWSCKHVCADLNIQDELPHLSYWRIVLDVDHPRIWIEHTELLTSVFTWVSEKSWRHHWHWINNIIRENAVHHTELRYS